MKKKERFDKEAFRGDFHDLYRKLVGLVKLSDCKDFDSLAGQDRIEFLKFCHQTFNSKHFPLIVKHLIFEHVRKAGVESETFDETIVNRASVNGIAIVEEFFSKYSKKYDHEFPGEQSEEPELNTAFDPVNIES